MCFTLSERDYAVDDFKHAGAVAEVVKRASPDDAFERLLTNASQVGVLAEMLNRTEASNFLSSLHKRRDCGFADILDRREAETDGAAALLCRVDGEVDLAPVDAWRIDGDIHPAALRYCSRNPVGVVLV